MWIARDGLPRFESARDAALATASGLRRVFKLDDAAADVVKLVDIQPAGRAYVARFSQRVGDVEIFRSGLTILLNSDREPISASGSLVPSLVGATRPFAIDEAEALSRAHAALTGNGVAAWRIDVVGEHHRFSLPGLAQPARVKRVLFPHLDTSAPSLSPAYYVELMFANGPAWSFVIAADSGEELFRNNLVRNDAFSYRAYANSSTLLPMDGPQGVAASPHPTGLIDSQKLTMVPSQLVTLQNYPFSKNDPWLAPGATQTKGNNVDAYSDASGSSGFDATDIRAAVTAPGCSTIRT